MLKMYQVIFVKKLTDPTFTSTFSVLTIGVAFVAVASLILVVEPGALTGAFLVGGALVTMARVALGLGYRWKRPEGDETAIRLRWYAVGGCSFSALIAALSVWSTPRSHSDCEVPATTILFAYSTGMIVRIAVSPKLAPAQSLIAFVPAAAVNGMAGTTAHLLFAGLQLAFAISYSEMIKYHFETSLGRARSQREMAQRSLLDRLTGLPNWAYFRQRLDEEWTGWQGGNEGFILDLDGFKAASDRFGHAAGKVIRVVLSSPYDA